MPPAQASSVPLAMWPTGVPATEPAHARSLHLVGSGRPPCGIGDFSRLLLDTLQGAEPGAHAALIVEPRRFDIARIWRALGQADTVVANVPVVSWKRALFGPLAIDALGFLRGRTRVTILHEWGSMHRLRRLVLRPVLLLSNRIVLVSPVVTAELAADPLIGFLAKRAALMPLPPNLARPSRSVASALSERLETARTEGRLVLGHFGSIYPGKHPQAMLDIAAELKARGAKPLLVFMGSFIKASDGIEALFWTKVEALGLSEEVIVSGYVASTPELFGLFEQADAFAYVLPEGLTSRRASVLACVQAGRPVVVTAPERADEFDHHPRFRALVESGAIVLVPRAAPASAYAERILANRSRPTAVPDLDMAVWFRDAADALRGLFATVAPGRAKTIRG